MGINDKRISSIASACVGVLRCFIANLGFAAKHENLILRDNACVLFSI